MSRLHDVVHPCRMYGPYGNTVQHPVTELPSYAGHVVCSLGSREAHSRFRLTADAAMQTGVLGRASLAEH